MAGRGLDPANALVLPFGSAAIAAGWQSVAPLPWKTDAVATFSPGESVLLDEATFWGLEVSSTFSAVRAGLTAAVSSIEARP